MPVYIADKICHRMMNIQQVVDDCKVLMLTPDTSLRQEQIRYLLPVTSPHTLISISRLCTHSLDYINAICCLGAPDLTRDTAYATVIL